MKDELEPDLLDEARQLLDLGKVQEALMLAMDLLRRELDQLHEVLECERENSPSSADRAATDHPWPGPLWAEPPSRLLH